MKITYFHSLCFHSGLNFRRLKVKRNSKLSSFLYTFVIYVLMDKYNLKRFSNKV